MRSSVLQCGVFAILVGLSPSPWARAQNDDGRGGRRQDSQNVSDYPVHFAFALNESQDPPAKTDRGQRQDAAQGDLQVTNEYLKALGRASQYQGANPQRQPSANWNWTRDQDAALWLAYPYERSSGISLVPVDDALRSHLKLPKDQGLLVTAIDPHSPAAQAGLHQNDVLLKLGDSPLSTPLHLEAALKAAGDKPVVLLFYRDGSARKIQVLPRIQVTFGPVPVQPPASQFWIGVSVADIEPALRAQLRLPANKGLLVNQVFKDSPADKAGLKVNDILLSIDGKPLLDQKKLIELVQASGEKTVTVEVLHEGKPRGDVEITPERRKLTQLSDPTQQLQAFRWEVVRPGVMLNLTSPNQVQLHELNDVTSSWESKLKDQIRLLNDVTSSLESKLKDQQPKDPNAALPKRLDDLDAEIKKLRKALEELGGASKATAELNQAIELLKKLSADKK